MERMKGCTSYSIYSMQIYPAGWDLDSNNVHKALSEVPIESPDYGKIGKKLGLQLTGSVTGHILFKGWQMHGLEMTWTMLAHALDRMEGYQLPARRARQKKGIVLLIFI